MSEIQQIQPLIDFVVQNASLLKGGVGGIAGTTIVWSPARKMLLEKCSTYLGISIKSKDIKDTATAEGEAEVIKARYSSRAIIEAKKEEALGTIELLELEERINNRLSHQERIKQQNIDSIIIGSLNSVNDDAQPQNIDPDWLYSFFDNAPSISDQEMQFVMGQILAGEANKPGSFSKRVVILLQSLSKKEAEIFRSPCSFCIRNVAGLSPAIYDLNATIYNDNNIYYRNIVVLESLNLISYTGFSDSAIVKEVSGTLYPMYFDVVTELTVPSDFNLGCVVFTELGFELARVIKPRYIKEFEGYLKQQWQAKGYAPHAEKLDWKRYQKDGSETPLLAIIEHDPTSENGDDLIASCPVLGIVGRGKTRVEAYTNLEQDNLEILGNIEEIERRLALNQTDAPNEETQQ